MLKILIITAALIAISAFVWYISTRDTSSLALTENKITLSLNKNKTVLNADILDKISMEFKTLQITQTILKLEDKTLLVFEESNTDNMYQYNFSTPTSIYMALGAREINLLLQSNNLYFAQVKLQNRKYLNVIARQSDDQSLTLLYGMSDTLLLNIIHALWEGNTSMENEMWQNAMTISTQEDAILTEWSTPLHAIEGLVTPSDKE